MYEYKDIIYGTKRYEKMFRESTVANKEQTFTPTLEIRLDGQRNNKQLTSPVHWENVRHFKYANLQKSALRGMKRIL